MSGVNPIDEQVKKLADQKLDAIEAYQDADFISFYGPITYGLAAHIRSMIEEIASEKKHHKLLFMLTTNGGIAEEVGRIVNVLRHFYEEVSFVIPDYAYSAGTILCMSGDIIYMDYFSVLGPIDPQIAKQDGTLIPAQGYLDKVDEFIEKSKQGLLSDAEMIMLNKVDLADLRRYEQARNLTIDLLKDWLVKYKFKTWTKHRTHSPGKKVTKAAKNKRAGWIAKQLSDNNVWKTHDRGLDIDILHDKLKLDIVNYGENPELSKLFREYFDLIMNYIRKNGFTFFTHTRRFF